MRGADGTAPVVAPQKYWAAHYQCGKGHKAADDWFRGYSDGACAAKNCCGCYVDVPYSNCAPAIRDPYFCNQADCGYPCNDPYVTEHYAPPIEYPMATDSQQLSAPPAKPAEASAGNTAAEATPAKATEVPDPPGSNRKSDGIKGKVDSLINPNEDSKGTSNGYSLPPFRDVSAPRTLNHGDLRPGTPANSPYSTTTPTPRTQPVGLGLEDYRPVEETQPSLPESSPKYELPTYDSASSRYAPVQPAQPIKF